MNKKLLLTTMKPYQKHLQFFFTVLISWMIIISNSLPIHSQSTPNNSDQNQPIDTTELAETIEQVELKWQKEYEGYFQRQFINYNRSAQQIGEHLAEISQKTGLHPAVIWAIPKPEFLQLLLITPQNNLVMKKIRSANQVTLNLIVTQFTNAIADRNSTKYLPPGRQLYKWLFTPFEADLQAENIDTILLCTGQKLRSLPFAALHDGEKFVIEKYNLSRIPAFNLTDTSYTDKLDKRVLAMGASEFATQPSLPGVALEIDTITPKLWDGQKMLNQDFTVENLIAAHQQGNFDIIHLATHAEFQSGSPDQSYIQFSDRTLQLDEINSLNLNDPPVDLLVLSACKTALGDEEAEFGFAGLAMQAGVKSVLASLWSINDAGTVALMSEFYQHLKETPIKAKALQQAQVAMLHGKVSLTEGQLRGSEVSLPLPPELTSTSIEQQNLAHPFYWAGFTIIGNPW